MPETAVAQDTTSSAPLPFPPASIGKRVAATLIDLALISLTLNLLRLFTDINGPDGNFTTFTLVFFNSLFLVNLILNSYGGTAGKRLLGLATVDARTGKHIGLLRGIGRVVIMVLAIVPLRGWFFATSVAHYALERDTYPSLFIYDRWTHSAVVDKRAAAKVAA